MNPGGPPRDFDVIQLDRAGILFAVPRGEVHKPDPFEVVRKKLVASACEISRRLGSRLDPE